MYKNLKNENDVKEHHNALLLKRSVRKYLHHSERLLEISLMSLWHVECECVDGVHIVRIQGVTRSGERVKGKQIVKTTKRK